MRNLEILTGSLSEMNHSENSPAVFSWWASGNQSCLEFWALGIGPALIKIDVILQVGRLWWRGTFIGQSQVWSVQLWNMRHSLNYFCSVCLSISTSPLSTPFSLGLSSWTMFFLFPTFPLRRLICMSSSIRLTWSGWSTTIWLKAWTKLWKLIQLNDDLDAAPKDDPDHCLDGDPRERLL